MQEQLPAITVDDGSEHMDCVNVDLYFAVNAENAKKENRSKISAYTENPKTKLCGQIIKKVIKIAL